MTSDAGGSSSSIAREFDGAVLGDRRLTARLHRIVESMSAEPSASFPQAAGNEAELEATYRFLRNNQVEPAALLSPHLAASGARASQHAVCVIAHDTTQFQFGGRSERKGLGPLRGAGAQGFLGHFSLAVSADGARYPFGVVAMQPLFRTVPRKVKRSSRDLKADPLNESKRWLEGVEQSQAQLTPGCAAIHVMDREGDAYELLSALADRGRQFVIRSAHDRASTTRLEGSKTKFEKMSRRLAGTPAIAEREVPLSPRSGKGKSEQAQKINPPRGYRLARLTFRAKPVELRRPPSAPRQCSAALHVNVVEVQEVDVPQGVEPVRWTLLTSEPIETAEQILYVVDCYRARWTIEEYFKALKQGCAYEQRQLESRETLLVALSIFVPIAWRLLLLRNLGRQAPDRPATDVLTPTLLAVLIATSKRPLPPRPTVRDAMLAIAARGGHLRNNGEPGWLVLGRGFHDLLMLERGWIAATKTARRPIESSQFTDQS